MERPHLPGAVTTKPETLIHRPQLWPSTEAIQLQIPNSLLDKLQAIQHIKQA
jgi:hypothetical protein